MNIFRRYFFRRIGFSLLLISLLAASCATFLLGVTAYSGIMQEWREADEKYTTIAVPLPEDASALSDKWMNGGFMEEDGKDGSVTYGAAAIEKVAKTAPQVKAVQNGSYLSAILKNAEGLSSGDADITQYNYSFDQYTYSFCVLAVECISVEDKTDFFFLEEETNPTMHDAVGEDANGENQTFYEMCYRAEFRILGAPSLKDSYQSPVGERIGMSSSIYCKDGTIPIEPGKRYLIRGYYSDGAMSWNWDTTADPPAFALQFAKEELSPRRQFSFSSLGTETLPGFCTKRGDLEGTNLFYAYAPEGQLPFLEEYEGDYATFLKSEAGTVWREEIIPWTQENQNSATVLGIESLNSMYLFNTGDAFLLQGRDFSQPEQNGGAHACIVSVEFAEKNNLKIGDCLSFICVDTGAYFDRVVRCISTTHTQAFPLYQRLTTMQNAEGVVKQTEYTVVGIYSGPSFSGGTYQFSPDTILIPKKAVPNAEQYEAHEIPYLNAMILKNGTTQEFETYMEKHDMAERFSYLDMDYQNAQDVFMAMRSSAIRLLLIGCMVFCIGTAVVFSLMVHVTKPTMQIAYMLGMTRKELSRQVFLAFFELLVPGVVLGSAVVFFLHSRMLHLFLAQSTALGKTGIWVVGIGQLLMLMAADFLVCTVVCREKGTGKG